MGEVSTLTNLPPHVLRNWEKTYRELKPKKTVLETVPTPIKMWLLFSKSKS